jgi:hypothetical protein
MLRYKKIKTIKKIREILVIIDANKLYKNNNKNLNHQEAILETRMC